MNAAITELLWTKPATTRWHRITRWISSLFAVTGLALLSLDDKVFASPPTASEALSLAPVQANVLYDLVPAEKQDDCIVRDLTSEQWGGWEVLDPEGRQLRVFADTNGDKKVDLWCYYASGIEVYRDIDENFNGKADQYRWLGTNGTRWGLDQDEDGTIDQWKTISAEEASAEVIRAFREQDSKVFGAILATQDELTAAGFGPELTKKHLSNIREAVQKFPKLAATQRQISDSTRWLQFAGQGPGTLPQNGSDVITDVIVYDSAVALYQTPLDNDRVTGQIFLGPLLRVGNNWRLLGLPLFDEQLALNDASKSFFSDRPVSIAAPESGLAMSESTQKLITELEAIDQSLSSQVTEGGEPNLEQLNQRRADVIESLIAASASTEEKDSWTRQLIDMLAISAQISDYSDADRRLRDLAKKLDADQSTVRDYARYQSITTDYLVNQLANEDFAAVQSSYIEKLKQFVEDFPQSPLSADAWNQLALQKEFENDPQAATTIYNQIVSKFPNSSQAEIAAGAIRRIESIGKRIDLRGTTIAGGEFQLSKLRGKVVVLHYWATWCSPCLQDIKALKQIQASYRNSNLEIVGINVDVDADKTQQYLRQNQIPWTQLFELGGLEGSGLAKALGIQTLPAMLLIDQDGRVLDNNLQVNQLQQELARRIR